MKIFALFTLLFCVATAGGQKDSDVDNEGNSIRRLHRTRSTDTVEDWVSKRGAFSTLVSVLVAAGLAPDGVLDGDGAFTLFAPTDNAFARTFATYPGVDEVLVNDPEGALTQVLTYHVLAQEVLSGDIPRSGVTVSTAQGDSLTAFKQCYWWWAWLVCGIGLKDGSPDIAWVTHPDRLASNGVVHAIDKVLIPPSLAPTVEGLRAPGH